jgi:uncharacterized protein (TIGR04255 family)
MSDKHRERPDSVVDYERPPVVETILGVQFDPLSRMSNAHQGLFWSGLGASWPKLSDSPPLEPQFERFTGENWLAPNIAFRVVQTMSSRLQIKNEEEDRLIQLQNGRLHLNWLGNGGGDYPRFSRTLSEFVEIVERFHRFTAEQNLGEFRPNQWEVTYINQIPQGTVWNSPSDWSFFLPLSNLHKQRLTVQLESFNGEWHFVIPENRGRLHVQWQHGKTREPSKEMIGLTLTARGPLESDPKEFQAGFEQLRGGLEIGHNAIVRSFRDLMSAEANRYWGLKKCP